jgi:hypothetical protein
MAQPASGKDTTTHCTTDECKQPDSNEAYATMIGILKNTGNFMVYAWHFRGSGLGRC